VNINLSDKNLTYIEKNEIEVLLKRSQKGLTDLEQMWYLMDLVWEDFECSNKKLNWEKIARFYSHPVWLLNGLFAEQDSVSMQHRHSISDWVVERDSQNIVDYGGGFGTLARLIADKNTATNVSIYEPHPSEFGLKRVQEYSNITMINQLEHGYDVLLCTDVLEHVPSPLDDFESMIKSVKVGGYLIIANCFYPVIKCHLPSTFYLRYTFNLFAKLMGLKVIGPLKGSHATIFLKVRKGENNWKMIRLMEGVSKLIFPVVQLTAFFLRFIKRMFFK
jgi:2-polyprenyl-3-methyl-5-hydroxy-6-metoxy-1,4-benzoquinol methylase